LDWTKILAISHAKISSLYSKITLYSFNCY